MKNSGIEWIGEIPDGWEVNLVKNIFDITRGRVIAKTEIEEEFMEGYYPVYSSQTANSGILGYIPSYDFAIDSLTWTTDGAKAGTVFLRKGKYSITNVCGILTLKTSEYSLNYLYYAVGFSAYNSRRADINGYKIMSNEMAAISIPVPDKGEQQKIAEILDEKCGKIDKLIENEQKQIEKMKEYKQSVITSAVTKGLDKSAPLKDSGIEWIGEIPAHWDIIATKSLFDVIAGATPDSSNPLNWDGAIRWITPADYKTEDIYVEFGRRNLSKIGFNSCSTSLIPAGNIIFSKRAPIGAVAINNTELCTNQGCLSCVNKGLANIKFYYYIMSIATEQYELLGSGTTFKEISCNTFSNFRLPYPSLETQQQIADYLDDKCGKIDRLIAIKQEKIEKLQEYKKSLIYEYVTGKKEVV